MLISVLKNKDNILVQRELRSPDRSRPELPVSCTCSLEAPPIRVEDPIHTADVTLAGFTSSTTSQEQKY